MLEQDFLKSFETGCQYDELNVAELGSTIDGQKYSFLVNIGHEFEFCNKLRN